MDASQRIEVILEISRRLGAEDWAVIDLTLRQFGLPTTDMWSDGRVDYVMNSVEKADAATLRDLGRHLGLEVNGSRPTTNPDFWRDGYLRLFISHLAAHKVFAAEMQTVLTRYGISSFVAHNDIEPTREWADEIETALGTCDAALAIMHPGFHESYWVDQELGFVMGRGVPILTARLGQDPYGFLGRFQALKSQNGNGPILAEEVFRVLASHKVTGIRVSSALVSRLEASESFADAKAIMEVLERAVYWDRALTERCRFAIDANNQVRDAFGVPERIEALVSRQEN